MIIYSDTKKEIINLTGIKCYANYIVFQYYYIFYHLSQFFFMVKIPGTQPNKNHKIKIDLYFLTFSLEKLTLSAP